MLSFRYCIIIYVAVTDYWVIITSLVWEAVYYWAIYACSILEKVRVSYVKGCTLWYK